MPAPSAPPPAATARRAAPSRTTSTRPAPTRTPDAPPSRPRPSAGPQPNPRGDQLHGFAVRVPHLDRPGPDPAKHVANLRRRPAHDVPQQVGQLLRHRRRLLARDPSANLPSPFVQLPL